MEDVMKIDKFEDGGTLYFELYVAHPVSLGQGKSSLAHYIEHADNECGGHVYIGDNAMLKCVKCNASAHISKWKYVNIEEGFSLSLEEGDPINGSADFMSLAGQIVTVTGLSWLHKFMDNL